MKAATIASQVKELFEAGRIEEGERYIFWVSDSLRDAEDDGDVQRIFELTKDEPILTGLPIFDAAVAGLADRHCSAIGLPVPEWVTEPSRYITPVGFGGTTVVWDDVDARLREHGAIIMEYSLETKRQYARRLDRDEAEGLRRET